LGHQTAYKRQFSSQKVSLLSKSAQELTNEFNYDERCAKNIELISEILMEHSIKMMR